MTKKMTQKQVEILFEKLNAREDELNAREDELRNALFDKEFALRALKKRTNVKTNVHANANTNVHYNANKRSRRSLIIEMLHDSLTVNEMLSMLTQNGYNDARANKKAISGTVFDLRTNKQLDIRKRVNDDDKAYYVVM